MIGLKGETKDNLKKRSTNYLKYMVKTLFDFGERVGGRGWWRGEEGGVGSVNDVLHLHLNPSHCTIIKLSEDIWQELLYSFENLNIKYTTGQ